MKKPLFIQHFDHCFSIQLKSNSIQTHTYSKTLNPQAFHPHSTTQNFKSVETNILNIIIPAL